MMCSKIASMITLSVMLAAMAYIPQQGVVSAETAAIIDDCEGNACEQVTVTWDEAKQQYKVQNNSTDKSMRVDAANLVASATVCVAPGKTDYLPLKSIAGAYHATCQQTCANPQQ